MTTERRRYKRYPAAGQAEFSTASMKATGELLDIAEGGVLIRSLVKPSDGIGATVRFAVSDYPRVFVADGQVVRVQMSTLVIKFFGKPPELDELLQWLERR